MDLNILLANTGVLSDKAKEVIERPVTDLLKTREQGKSSFKYIPGSNVIKLLNEAFDYKWSFRVISKEIVSSIDKYDSYKKEYVSQAPYIEVLGELIVPELNVVKQQYGTKILLGGASEQEGAAKAAATDALKKCATELGIALDLDAEQADTVPHYDTPAPPKRSTTPKAPPAPAPPAPSNVLTEWQAEDVQQLREYKTTLGITDNEQLNPYVREFFNHAKATVEMIEPSNIKGFNEFLARKIKETN